MRLLNDELAKNILEASKKEFLEKGFQLFDDILLFLGSGATAEA